MRHEQHPHGPLEPQDIEELLPWYVTGRVSREEARGIEAALKTMPDLADKLAQVQRERDGVARASETVEAPPPETLQKLLQQVETTRQWRIPRVESQGDGGWVKVALGQRTVWQVGFAAACIAIVVLGVRVYNPPVEPGSYGVAAEAMMGRSAGATVLVTFAPTATLADIASVLTDLNASIVDGPKPGGTYVVAVPGAADVDAAIAALTSHKDLVLSALPGS